ncbi:alpha-galactosidase [Ostertagia ostertagi]
MRLLWMILSISAGALGLDNGLARTPPMGWMSWTQFRCQTNCDKYPDDCINEKLYQEMADRLVSDGYRDAGYNHIHIDDCWMERSRDADGRLVADHTRFPAGIKALAQYVSGFFLQLEYYINRDIFQRNGDHMTVRRKQIRKFQIDAQTFADWECDYLKLDGCHMKQSEQGVGYPEMEQALNATGRPIMYSCEWPYYLIDEQKQINYTAIAQSCNLWRNFNDVSNSWASILSIMAFYNRFQNELIEVTGPGQWNDPDMLVIGMKNGLTVDQAKVQMSVWSIWSAPLIMSNDLREIDPKFKEILLNRDVIAIDQDPMGKMGRLMLSNDNTAVYVKPVMPREVSDTSFAIAVVNKHLSVTYTIKFALNKVGMNHEAGYQIKDLWSGQDMGVFKPTDTLTVQVPATGAAMFKATIV